MKARHWLIVLVVGLVLLGLGTVGMARGVVCGGQAMYPGDRCVSYGGTGGSNTSYDQEQFTQHATAVVEIVLGSAGVIGGAVGFAVSRARRR